MSTRLKCAILLLLCVLMTSGAYYFSMKYTNPQHGTSGYVKDLKAVVSKPIIAVGGANADNIPAFMQVCAGVGIGSAVYKKGRTPDEIRKAAALLVNSFKTIC